MPSPTKAVGSGTVTARHRKVVDGELCPLAVLVIDEFEVERAAIRHRSSYWSADGLASRKARVGLRASA